MQTKLLLLFLLIFISACSTAEPKNKWQYDAVSSLTKFQTYFLQNHLIRAKSNLSHAREFASQSVHLHTLINIELSVCALQVGTFRSTNCEAATQLLSVEPDPSQLAYLHFLNLSLRKGELELLPKQYQDFAQSFLEQDAEKINDELDSIRPLSSRLIASALAKDLINDENIEELINELSYRGYKNPILVWLNVQMQRESDPLNKAKIKAKIAVLTSS